MRLDKLDISSIRIMHVHLSYSTPEYDITNNNENALSALSLSTWSTLPQTVTCIFIELLAIHKFY